MAKLERLEEIIDSTEPDATFHDADVLTISVDYQHLILKFKMMLCVGDPNAKCEAERERRRPCEVVFSGLQHWSIGLPDSNYKKISGPLWMTSDGPLIDCPTKKAKELIKVNYNDDIQWYLYFSDINTFTYIVASGVSFKWISL